MNFISIKKHEMEILTFWNLSTQPHSHIAIQPHSYIATQPQSHIATQLHSHKGGGLRPPPQRGGGLRPPPLCGFPLWLCSYVAMWLCGYVAMQLCGYMAMWLCGYVAKWLSWEFGFLHFCHDFFQIIGSFSTFEYKNWSSRIK